MRMLSLILPAVIFLAAFFCGMSPSKIPPELSLRKDGFDLGLFSGIADEYELIGEAEGKDFLNKLLFHPDPFFALAWLLPSHALFILYFGYLLKFSLACPW